MFRRLRPSNRTPTKWFRLGFCCFASRAEEEDVGTGEEERSEQEKITRMKNEEDENNVKAEVIKEEGTDVTYGKHTGTAGNGDITGTVGEENGNTNDEETKSTGGEEIDSTEGKEVESAEWEEIDITEGEYIKDTGDEVIEVIDITEVEEININRDAYQYFKEQERNDSTGFENNELWDEFTVVFKRLGMEIDVTIYSLHN